METFDVPTLTPAMPSAVSAEPLPVWEAFLTGVRQALRGWPALLLMLLATLVAAGLLALIPALNLLKLAHNPVITDLAGGVKAWMLVDLDRILSSSTAARGAAANGAQNNLSMLLVMLILSPLVGGLVSAFAWGGVLLTYHDGAESFSLRRCLWGCWHWFGAYLALALLQALAFVVVFLPVGALLLLLGRLGAPGIATAVILLAGFLLLWAMIFELARVQLVVAGTRNPFRGLGRAFQRIFRRPLGLLGFYALALLVLLAVQVFFRLGVNPIVPLDALLPALLAQQGFILARLFARALRLAGLTAMG